MAASKRKPISKKIRFEVFKRDSFTCQYCGKSAPDVILHVDHIDPVSKGGDNSIINLITSCADCNGGKSDVKLDDQAMLAKQRQQLAELSERREQLKLMVEWRKEMKSIGDMELEAVKDHFATVFHGWRIESDKAVASLKRLVRQFGISLLMECMEIAREQYVTDLGDQEQVNLAFRRLGGICNNKSNPDEGALFYARGIIRNRLTYCNESVALHVLRQARSAGVSDEQIKYVAKVAKSWSDWQLRMADEIEEAAAQ